MSLVYRTLMVVGITLMLCLALAGSAAAKGPGGHTETYGNNLSLPVIFSEGYGILGGQVDVNGGTGFRGTMGVDNFDTLTTYSPYYYAGLLDYDGSSLWSNWLYAQKTEATWQAGWANGSGAPLVVDYIDWGDSLLSRTWKTTSQIRVEVALYRANNEGLQGYLMNHISGTGTTEVWGAADFTPAAPDVTAASGEPQTYTPSEGTVYSNCAVIEVFKLDAAGLPVAPAVFSYPVWQKYGQTGPGGFSAEVNVGGKCIYGFNWSPKTNALQSGSYRVQFRLAGGAAWTVSGETGSTTASVTRNVSILTVNPADLGFTYKPVLGDDYTSYVDVTLAPGGGGKRP